ncbi:MAG: helix-turn-helix transcriptional regulator [Muribaculaceae bacterium]|nr:helix-turn-helix transcriptional regulator [Muribaculaceae bacterium]
MKQVGDMKLYTLEEVKDEIIGKIGTPERDEYEKELEEELHAYHIGKAIKEARKEKNLTQEQLGELMGVRRAQISKIESGKNLNFSTIARAFKAMDIPANLAFGNVRISLW